MGQVTSIETNEFGAVIKRTDALGGVTTYTRDANNNVTQVIDENANRSNYTYDQYGNLLTATETIGSTSRTTRYEYMINPWANFHRPTAIVDAKGGRTTFKYDTRGNVVEIIDSENNVTEFTYNSIGQVLSVSNAFTHTGNHYEYDLSGNLVTIKDAFHRTLSTFTYDTRGNVLTQTDAKSNTTTFTYDSLDRVLTQTDAKGGVTTFTYDSQGNLTSLTDAKNKTTTFSYDSLDRLISRTDPLGRSESYVYDFNGNLVAKTDRNGNTTAYDYDALNREIRRLYPDGGNMNFTYDAKGNLLTAQDSDSMLAFAYDAFDRLTMTSTATSPSQPDVAIIYNYDHNNNVTTVVDSLTSSLKQVLYGYDKNDNLISIKRGSQNDLYPVRLRYDRSQRRSEVLYPNGIKSAYSYMPGKIAQLTKINHSDSGGDVSSFEYSYDLNDNITALETTRSEITVNSPLAYVYDTINQLTSATKPQESGNETFTYDLIGNRLRKDAETIDSIFNDNNQLTNDKTYSYTFDNNGNQLSRTNLTTGQVREHTWDYENRLVQVIDKPTLMAMPSSTTTYKYDALGRRIEKNVNGTITRYVYSGSNIYLEFDGNNAFKARYIHGDSIDRPYIMERENTAYHDNSYAQQDFFYHADRLGSITELTDFSGEVVQRYVYDSFGNSKIYDDNGTLITHTSANYLKNPYENGGRERDPETGYYYHRNRYRNGDRWLSEDPIGFAGGDSNLYGYALNNPINFLDPEGTGPIGGAVCIVSDIALNFVTNYFKYRKYNKLAELQQKRIDAFQREIDELPLTCGNEDEEQILRDTLEKQLQLVKSDQAFLDAQANRALLKGVGQTTGGAVICRGISRLPSP